MVFGLVACGDNTPANTEPSENTQGTTPSGENTDPTTNVSDPTDEGLTPELPETVPQESETSPNIDDQKPTQPEGDTTTPTEPKPTEPKPTEPKPTEPKPTEPVDPPAGEATADQMKNVVATKTASAGGAITAHPGGRITYTIKITNNNKSAIGVKVSDTLPAGTSLVSGCNSVSGNNLSWNVNSIGAGKTHTITYTVKPEYTIKQVRESKTDIIIKNTSAKVMDKVVDAPAKDIWVLETFNAEDCRKIEMGIDAMVTANLTAKNSYKLAMNRIPLLNMMYYVGFSTAPGFGTTVADPAEILTAIYDKAGQSGSNSGSAGTEDVVETATNLLHKVVPTLYGGTKVPSSKDSLFRGARATSVTAADLISGDVIFVENGGKAKLYVYDGSCLVELAETKVTTNITPSTVLSTLPSSDRYVVIRVSFNYNITFSLNEGEYFNNADKQGYTELEKALIATAEAYLLRGDRTQYTDDMTGTSIYRWETAVKQPEDYTVDQYGYTNCAAFTHDVHWATYGVAPKAKNTSGSSVTLNTTANLASSAAYGWNADTLKGNNKSTVYYCTPMAKNASGDYVSTMTAAQQEAAKQQIISLLRPGDIICIRRTTGSGHAMLYVGNGTIIHSSGSSYSDTNKTDTHEASIRFRMVADLFDASIYNETSYVFNLVSFSIVRPQNLTTAKISTNTANRVNNMQGIIGEKISSTAMGKTVNPGDTITYTFYVFNTNKSAKTVSIKDVLSQHVTFVSATNNGSVSGSNISWSINVPAETRISVSYTVKVKSGVAAYTAIDGSKATINGVSHKCFNTYIANTLTAAQQQQLVDAVKKVKAMNVNGLNSVEIVELIYKTAFGVENIFGSEVTNYSMLLDGGNNQKNTKDGIVKGKDNVGVFNDAWYWESKNFSTVALMNHNTSNPAMMVAPGLYGGYLVMNSSYNKNNRDETFTRYTNLVGGTLRSRYFWEKDLVIGDIFLMKGSSSEQMYIYIGNDTFVSVGTDFAVFTEKSVSERFQYAPHDTWKKLAVLRPSIVLDI